jgi:hypothetical protein
MAQPSKPVSGSAAAAAPTSVALLCGVAWLVPGGGHFMLGQTRKAVTFFIILSGMYVIGLVLGGRLFPFERSEPLVFLAAFAQWTLALPRMAALIGGFGQGHVTAATYEYGNTFIIVSGLLNALVMLDTYDLAAGRKPR